MDGAHDLESSPAEPEAETAQESRGAEQEETRLKQGHSHHHHQVVDIARSISSVSTRASKILVAKVGSFLGVSDSDPDNGMDNWRDKFVHNVQSGSVGIQFSDLGLVPNSRSRQEIAMTTGMETALSHVSVASDHLQQQLDHLAEDEDIAVDPSDDEDAEDAESDANTVGGSPITTRDIQAMGIELTPSPSAGHAADVSRSLPVFPVHASRPLSKTKGNVTLSGNENVTVHRPSSISFSDPLQEFEKTPSRASLLKTLLRNKMSLPRRHSDPDFTRCVRPPPSPSAKPAKSILKKHPSCPDVNAPEQSSLSTGTSVTDGEQSDEEGNDVEVFYRAEGLRQYLQYVQMEKDHKQQALNRKMSRIEKSLLIRQETILETMSMAKAFYSGKSKPCGTKARWKQVVEKLRGDSSHGRTSRARRDPNVRKQLELLPEHVPWFTYIFILFQVIALLVAMSVYGGITSVGLEPELQFFEVLTFRGVETVEHWRLHNIWIGPSQAFFIESGALFAPCMRDDHGIQLLHAQSPWINMTSLSDLGCCEVDFRNTAGTTTSWECANYTAGVGEWLDGVACTERAHAQSNTAHVIKPCCYGNKAQCMMVTHEHCIFLEGTFFGDGPEHCSQVNCLSVLCKMGGLKSKPDHPYQAQTPNQWWRLPIAIFYHQGVVHLLLDVVVQFLVGRQIEVIAGWMRMACIYVISATMALLVGASVNPYIPHVGTSGATCGLLAVLLVEVFQSWKIIAGPWREICKLLLVLSLCLLSGTLPYVDNFVLLGGFVFGAMAGCVFLPYVTFGFWHTLARRVLILVALPLLVLCAVLTLYAFLHVQNVSDMCGDGCQYINCVPYTDTVCSLDDLW